MFLALGLEEFSAAAKAKKKVTFPVFAEEGSLVSSSWVFNASLILMWKIKAFSFIHEISSVLGRTVMMVVMMI